MSKKFPANDIGMAAEQSELDISQTDMDVSYFPDANVSLESDHDLNTTLNDAIKLKKNLGETFDQLTSKNSKRSATLELQHDDSKRLDLFERPVAAKIAHFEKQSASKKAIEDVNDYSNDESQGFAVYLRLRPSQESNETIEVLAKTIKDGQRVQKIRTHAPASSHVSKVARNGAGSTVKEFEFSEVFAEDADQEQVYNRTVHHYIQGVFRGESGLVFCYGITNAGKTYTVSGPDKALKSASIAPTWGLLPRALKTMLDMCMNRHAKNISIYISFFEIYNEKIYDLLSMQTTNGRTTAELKKSIQSVSSHELYSLHEALSFVSQAKSNRRSATNSINNDSSRSHAICQLQVLNKSSKKTSNLWIVDLAGSERSKRTGGTRQHEAVAINQSLMTLNRCLTGLRSSSDEKDNVIPWRDSKLTRLFAAHWMGPFAKRTAMLVNVNPASSDFDETQHVLAYATVARNVKMDTIPKEKKTTGAEYDINGRRLQSTANDNKPSVAQHVAKVIGRLSPMRWKNTLKRKGEGKSADPIVYGTKAHASKKIRSEEPSKAEEDGRFSKMCPKLCEQKEIKSLKMQLSVLEVENQMLKTQLNEMQAENKEIQESLQTIETDVRDEVAEEMESQMQSMSDQYEHIIGCMKAQMDSLSSSKAYRPNHSNEDKLADMKEQLTECEDEMNRMRVEKEEEIQLLRSEFEQTLRERDETLAWQGCNMGEDGSKGFDIKSQKDPDSTNSSADVCTAGPKTTKQMSEIGQSSANADGKIEASNESCLIVEEPTPRELLENQVKSSSSVEDESYEVENPEEEGSIRQDKSSRDSGGKFKACDENSVIVGDAKASGLCDSKIESPLDEDQVSPAKNTEKKASVCESSNVLDSKNEASGGHHLNVEDTSASELLMDRVDWSEEEDESSSVDEAGANRFSSSIGRKEQYGHTREPFGTISENIETTSWTDENEKWLKPNAKIRMDPTTGLFLRPKGRKPKDAEYWDQHRGAWRLSVSMSDVDL